MKKIISLGAVLGISPLFAFAQTGTLFTIIQTIANLLNYILPVLIACAVIYFVWGIVQYMVAASDEEAKKAGRAKIINGLIGLFVIVAFWGIIAIVTNTFGFTTTNAPAAGGVPFTGTPNEYGLPTGSQ